jgi:hypothetical protein
LFLPDGGIPLCDLEEGVELGPPAWTEDRAAGCFGGFPIGDELPVPGLDTARVHGDGWQFGGDRVVPVQALHGVPGIRGGWG